MFGLLKKLFGVRSRPSGLLPEALVHVTFDSEGVRCRHPGGKVESIAWEKLDAVLIETTDEGPLLPDVFWLLLSRDMQSGCVIPQGATGENELMAELESRLPGFDNQMLIAAMASTDNQRFLLWERPAS